MGLVEVVFGVGVPHDTTDHKESEEEEEKCEREVLSPRALPHETSSHCSFHSNQVFLIISFPTLRRPPTPISAEIVSEETWV